MNRVLVIDIEFINEFADLKKWNSVFKRLQPTDSVIITATNAEDLKRGKDSIEKILREYFIHHANLVYSHQSLSKENTNDSFAANNIEIQDGKHISKLRKRAAMSFSLYFIPHAKLIDALKPSCDAAKDSLSTRFICLGNFPYLKDDFRKSFGDLENYFVIVRVEGDQVSNKSFHISFLVDGRKCLSPSTSSHDYFLYDFFYYVEDEVDEQVFVKKCVFVAKKYKKSIINLNDLLLKGDEKPKYLLSTAQLIEIIKNISVDVRMLNLGNFSNYLSTPNKTFDERVSKIIKYVPKSVEVVIISESDNHYKIVRGEDSKYIDKKHNEQRLESRRGSSQVRVHQTEDSDDKNKLISDQQFLIQNFRKVTIASQKREQELEKELTIYKANEEKLKADCVALNELKEKLKTDLASSEKCVRMLQGRLRNQSPGTGSQTEVKNLRPSSSAF